MKSRYAMLARLCDGHVEVPLCFLHEKAMQVYMVGWKTLVLIWEISERNMGRCMRIPHKSEIMAYQ